MKLGKYRKAIICGLGTLATWGITAAADEKYSQVELWGGLSAVVATVGLVYGIPNDRKR